MTFVESQSFFGPTNLGLQGENHLIGDKGSTLPSLNLIPLKTSKPTGNPVPFTASDLFFDSDHHLAVPSDHQSPDQASQIETSSSIRFKGSLFVYNRKQQPMSHPQQGSASDSQPSIEMVCPLNPVHSFSTDLDIPIAIRK